MYMYVCMSLFQHVLMSLLNTGLLFKARPVVHFRTKKRVNCDALQLETRRLASRSGL